MRLTSAGTGMVDAIVEAIGRPLTPEERFAARTAWHLAPNLEYTQRMVLARAAAEAVAVPDVVAFAAVATREGWTSMVFTSWGQVQEASASQTVHLLRPANLDVDPTLGLLHVADTLHPGTGRWVHVVEVDLPDGADPEGTRLRLRRELVRKWRALPEVTVDPEDRLVQVVMARGPNPGGTDSLLFAVAEIVGAVGGHSWREQRPLTPMEVSHAR